MWYNSNYLRMMLLAAYPGHIRIDFGRTVSENVTAKTQALDDVLTVGNNAYSTNGGRVGTYTYLDNSSGTFNFAMSVRATTISQPAEGIESPESAKEMAVFYHGYIQTGEDSMGEQSLLLYYEVFDEELPKPQLKEFGKSVAYAIGNFIRVYNPEEHARIVPVGISSVNGLGNTAYVEAKAVVATVNASVANTANTFPKYLGDGIYAMTSVYWHSGTATQLANYGSADQWGARPLVAQFKINDDGTATFKIQVPLDDSTIGNIPIGRIWGNVGNLRFDIMLPASAISSTAGDATDGAAAADRFTNEQANREVYEFVFTLGEADEQMTYLPNPLRAGRTVKYPTTYRKPSLLQFVRNAADTGWQSWPATGSAFNLKLNISKQLVAPIICWSAGSNNLNYRQTITHIESGVVVNEAIYPPVSQIGGLSGIIPGEYQLALSKPYSDNGSTGLSGVTPNLLEQDRVSVVEPTLLNLDLSGFDLETLRISDEGTYVPFEKDKVFLTLFGSEVVRTDEGIYYTPKLSTGAYSGRTDQIYVANGSEVTRIEIPLEATVNEAEVEEQTYHARVGTKYYTTESARGLRPSAVSETTGNWNFTVPVGYVHDLKVKNNLAFACRCELYNAGNDELLKSVVLGASVLPNSQHIFTELQPGKYQLVYTSIGMELETDKRPYITATNTQRQYNLLSVIADVAKPVFSIFKDDENQRDWDVYHRWSNQLVAFNFNSGRTWNLRSGRVVISKAGLVTYTPTINGTIVGIEDFTICMSYYSKDGRQSRHRSYRILIHPDIDIPSTPAIAVIDEMDVEFVGGTEYKITPKFTMYPTTREYTNHGVTVITGKAGTSVVTETLEDETEVQTVHVAKPVTAVGILVHVVDKTTNTKRGAGQVVTLADHWVKLTSDDVEIVTDKVTRNETTILEYRAKTFDASDLRERPVWEIAGNPNGVTVRHSNQLMLTADVIDPFKIRMYLRGLWLEKWITPFPQTDSVAIILPEGPFYPGDPIALSYSRTPPESLDNGEAVWAIHEGAAFATIEGNVVTFNPTDVSRRIRVRMGYKGKTAYQYIDCIPRPV